MSHILKRFLLGSVAGHWALKARSKGELIRAAIANDENIGCLMNHALAASLTTRICNPEMTFVDVGAHIGSVVAEVQRSSPSTEIIAIEAIPEKATELRRKFPGITVHQCAVGAKPGSVPFFVDLTQSGYSSLSRSNIQTKDAVREIQVDLRCLDDLIPVKGIDVIKIDVEGSELDVLRGATAVLAGSAPLCMFESAPIPLDGSGADRHEQAKADLWNFLNDRNYSVLLPNRLAHNDPGLGCHGFVESHLYPRRTTNYFAVPSQRRVEFRDRARRLLGITA